MLPNSKKSLINGGFSPRAAGWILIACFLGGVIGIQVMSHVMHQFIPSHIVDCEHSHDEEPKEDGHDHDHEHEHDQEGDVERHQPRPQPRTQGSTSSLPGHMATPGSGRRRSSVQTSYFNGSASNASYAPTTESEAANNPLRPSQTQPAAASRRPSLQARVSTTINQLTTGFKPSCDCDGPCYGYTDPCGQECFKKINGRGGFRAPLTTRASSGSLKPGLSRNATAPTNAPLNETTPLLEGIAEEDPRPQTEHLNHPPTRYYTVRESPSNEESEGSDSSATINPNLHRTHTDETTSSHNPDHHHHHVPTNAFLSIGLQTSIAIALHKLPEGFITYATNHANPSLGFAVFLALFIHNITEGFAMALPLYLAINSRWKAMVISFVLGGLSQPIGAAVAAVWFKLAGDGDWAPSEGVYGGMFAVTAGIMASVALQLFSESLDLTHSRGLCMIGAFVGMGILGVSSALTA